MCAIRFLRRGLLATALCIGVVGCREGRENATAVTAGATPVRVTPVVLGSITERIEVTGEVRPWSAVMLSSKVPGRLEKLGIADNAGGYLELREGMRVRKGEPLAQIDLAVYRARLQQAEAALAIAEAQWEDARREEQRVEALFKEGSATAQMRDKAVTARAIAEAGLAQTRAALSIARVEFEEATPKAPFDGVATRKHVDPGNVVAVGMPLVSLEELAKVKVLAAIPERYLGRITAGETKARLWGDSLAGSSIEAVVSNVHPAIDAATRTGTLEIVVDNPEGRLRSGAFLHVAIEVGRADKTVVVPLAAIAWQGQEAFAFVVEKGQARRRSVQVGIRDGEHCQITAGLNPGELLVTVRPETLRDGETVAIEEGGE